VHMPPTTRGQTPALSTLTPRGRARTSPRQDHARDGAQELTRHRSDDRIDRLLFLCLVLGGISGLPHRDTRARATSMSAAFLNVGVRAACARRAPPPRRQARGKPIAWPARPAGSRLQRCNPPAPPLGVPQSRTFFSASAIFASSPFFSALGGIVAPRARHTARCSPRFPCASAARASRHSPAAADSRF
jgi:hypothetical protein